MTETKFIGRSRALWAMLSPSIALILELFEVRQGTEMAHQIGLVAEAIGGLAGPLLWLWHWRRPDPRTPTVAPRKAAAATTVASLIVLMAPAPFIAGCAAIGHGDATPMQKYYEADQAVTAALRGAAIAIEAVGVDSIPPEARLAFLEAVNKVDALRDPVRDWVETCTSDAGCDPDEKARLSIATARVALAEALETYEDVCAVKPEGCASADKVRLVIRSIAKAVDLAEDIVTEVLGDGE